MDGGCGRPALPISPGWDGKRKKSKRKAAVVDGFTVSVLCDVSGLGVVVSKMTICSARGKDVGGCGGYSETSAAAAERQRLLRGAVLGPRGAEDGGNRPDVIMHVRLAHI